jgi:hypothetical protein
VILGFWETNNRVMCAGLQEERRPNPLGNRSTVRKVVQLILCLTTLNVYPRPLLEWIAGSGKHKLAVTAMPEAFFAIEQSHDLSTWTVIHRSQTDQTGVDIMPRPPSDEAVPVFFRAVFARQ